MIYDKIYAPIINDCGVCDTGSTEEEKAEEDADTAPEKSEEAEEWPGGTEPDESGSIEGKPEEF